MNEAVYHATLRRLGIEPAGARDGADRLTPGPCSHDRGALREPAEPITPARSSASQPDESVGRLLGLSLDAFGATGEMIEIRVPWWGEPLWFVPGKAAVETLVREAISRGRIWTAVELQDLLSLPTLSPAFARTVATAKLAMDGDIVAVRRMA